jgi:enoyl-CoA hydratase/carnithine racemase
MTSDMLRPLANTGLVLTEVNGALGLITLNRPSAENALTLAMIREMSEVVRRWSNNPAVQALVLLGQDEAGQPHHFCAGLDLMEAQKAISAGELDAEAFFEELYALHHELSTLTKPFIALMDGVVSGAGLAIAQVAKLRVVSERSNLAQAEAQETWLPVCGAAHALGALPGFVGEWLALTGEALAAGDAVEMGLADVFVPSSDWDAMVLALRTAPQPSAEHVVATVMERVELAPDASLLPRRTNVDRHFAHGDIGQIRRALLEAPPDDWTARAIQALSSKSTLAMNVNLTLIRKSRRKSWTDSLRLERDLAAHVMTSPELRAESFKHASPFDAATGQGQQHGGEPGSLSELMAWIESR